MYTKLWEASGLSHSDLMEKLIAQALARDEHRRKVYLSTYHPSLRRRHVLTAVSTA